MASPEEKKRNERKATLKRLHKEFLEKMRGEANGMGITIPPLPQKYHADLYPTIIAKQGKTEEESRKNVGMVMVLLGKLGICGIGTGYVSEYHASKDANVTLFVNGSQESVMLGLGYIPWIKVDSSDPVFPGPQLTKSDLILHVDDENDGKKIFNFVKELLEINGYSCSWWEGTAVGCEHGYRIETDLLPLNYIAVVAHVIV